MAGTPACAPNHPALRRRARHNPPGPRGGARDRDLDLRRHPRGQERQAVARLAGCGRGRAPVLPHRRPDGRRQPLHRPGIPARRHHHPARPPGYAGTRADEDTRRRLWTEHTTAQTRIETLRVERGDARRNALDEAIAPLLELAAPLRTGAQRDALAAYVIRKLHNTWSTR